MDGGVDELSLRASQGDVDAAASYFQQNRGLLIGMARRIGASVLDPEDLLSEVLLSLLEQWGRGRGPTTSINSYLIASMRNRVQDELRSPRSRVRTLTEADSESIQVDADVRFVDIRTERLLVAEAFRQLQPDQQRVLMEVVVNGRKPGQLTHLFDRAAGAVYTLLFRSKHALKRAVLQLVVAKTEREECIRASRDVPSQLPDSLNDAAAGQGLQHMRACAHCRSSWARYSSLATLSLVAPLTTFQLQPPPASAAPPATPATPAPPGSGKGAPLPHSLAGAEAEAIAEAPAGARAPALHTRRLTNGLFSRTRVLWATTAGKLLVGGIALVVAGSGVATASTVAMLTPTVASDGQLRATFVVSSVRDANTLKLSSALRVEQRQPSLTTIEMEFPESLGRVGLPDGWECSSRARVVSCTSTTLLDADFTLNISNGEPATDEQVLVRVNAQVDGQRIVGDVQIPASEPEASKAVSLGDSSDSH